MAKDTRQQGLTEYAAAVVEMTKRLVASKPTEEPLPRQPETHTIGVEEGIHFDGAGGLVSDVDGIRRKKQWQMDQVMPVARELFPPDGKAPEGMPTPDAVQLLDKKLRHLGIQRVDKKIGVDTLKKAIRRRESRKF
jgi:hypothetical protein